ncbi:hypothetical protein DFJ58DRAFT_811414 [Suillus subalutaceus]|uniref:uncharacterized protein n=1 Tax=Suillus subalutaceus TaxID=48586 RepID=UPI001B867F74|nr:uncharacterized protein DFJ58DRAFT_811414 [Suillus subalutaceus]KAG1839893.1 hypothetical protein DFJ58DRAFT_811414 [Suillus subalutaceus]
MFVLMLLLGLGLMLIRWIGRRLRGGLEAREKRTSLTHHLQACNRPNRRQVLMKAVLGRSVYYGAYLCLVSPKTLHHLHRILEPLL